ncbi:hypothetical protein ACFWOJ_07275 [Streptomyces sp. NPDC058439]|uniref:hypothetical protein n=1 Tax=Streptomyces sp. NPDC058439 TaxID=3346500 RepID=UPI00364DA24E
MHLASPGHRVLRQTAGAVGAVALMVLGAAPAVAADSDPGLVLGKIAPIDVKPGSEFSVPVSFTNTGTAALDKVWMAFGLSHGLSYTEVPSNCKIKQTGGADEMPSALGMYCEFDQTVKPGVVYAPEKTVTLKARDSAMYDQLGVQVSSRRIEMGTGEEGDYSEPGTAPAVKLVERPDATPAAPGSAEHGGWDMKSAKVTAKNTADFQLTGAQLKGKVGDTVPLAVKFTNAGPGWVPGEPEVSAAYVRIKMPAGTSVVKAHGFCHSVGSGTYECGTGNYWIYEDGGETYTFKLKIDKAVPGAKGSAAFVKKPRPFDPVKSNDTAAILLDVEGDGATGGSSSTPTPSSGSGDGATGGSSSTPTPEGSGTPPTGGSGSTSGSGSSTTGTSGSSSTGGDLANTGSGSALPLMAAAAGTVLLGAGAVLVARRRAARQR